MGSKKIKDAYVSQVCRYLRTKESIFNWDKLAITDDLTSNANSD